MKNNNPFPGLRPYAMDEAHLFFGREAQVDTMIAKLAKTHFLAVVGLSGSGKSSLVNCGLWPALAAGRMKSAGPAWRIATFRPGNDPVTAMAQALAEPGVLYSGAESGHFTLAEILESTLRLSQMGLIDAYEQAHLDPDVNLLVVVDQFEELFRYQGVGPPRIAGCNEAGDEATAFVKRLLEVRARRDLPIYVVVTMRSDFLGDSAQLPGLAEAINEGQYLVPRMTRDERRRAIEQPPLLAGAELNPVLLTRLVNDVGDNPDQLSILQHALNRTWAQWEKRGSQGPLDLEHYNAIGTMAGALDQHAEKAYAELTTDRQRQICERMFKALTDRATDPRGVRRPTTVETLCGLTGASTEELEEVMRVFRKPSRSFLMPPDGEPLRPRTVVDLSHESLMRVWERLRNWADDEAQAAFEYRRLAETARLYAADKASLWRDRDLERALIWRDQTAATALWAERYAPGFAEAMTFLDASVKSSDAERAAREEQLRRERKAEEERKTKDERYRTMMTVAVGVVLLAASLMWTVMKNAQAVERERDASVKEAKAARDIADALLAKQAAGKAIETAKQFEVAEAYELDEDVSVAERVKAVQRISTLAGAVPVQQRSDVTIEYFRKPSDSGKLGEALTQLGFQVRAIPAINPNPTNCIWYGADVPEADVKLVAYALIRGGSSLVGIQPHSNRSVKPRVVQVGHNGRLADAQPLTTEEIASTPVAQLRREQAEARADVVGRVVEFNPNTREGQIQTSEGRVYFSLEPDAPPLRVDEQVKSLVYYGRSRMYATKVVPVTRAP